MGLPRSTYHDAPAMKADDREIVAAMTAICDEFETYGYRRVGDHRAPDVGAHAVIKFAGRQARASMPRSSAPFFSAGSAGTSCSALVEGVDHVLRRPARA